MAAAVRSAKPIENMPFFPLMVDYREKHYAVGRIPGNFFRREGRPGTPETINARLVDRSIRPFFPKGFNYDVQVYLTVLSMDQKNPPSVVSLIAASAALCLSDIPFAGPVVGVRLGRKDGEFILNPTFEEREESELDLVVAGPKDALAMVESGSNCLPEDTILEGLELAQKSINDIIEKMTPFLEENGKEKIAFESPSHSEELEKEVKTKTAPGFEEIDKISDKHERENAVADLREKTINEIVEAKGLESEDEIAALTGEIKDIFDDAFQEHMRENVLAKGIRADGRALTEVRPIDVQTPFLPMTHGSALFTRGQTQSLGVTTLGTVGDQQRVDDLMGMSSERFLLHYNFPAYSVGETRRIMGPGRRELGHGMLAQRSLEPILPDEKDFPYTIRVVSEIMESNGSSSMASVCSGCLSLMDAGVPIKAPVAGIAMGLISDGERVAVLTDILGMEDHLGDMDFKVAGTADGITALQMDNKIGGLDFEVLRKALNQAKEARLHILGKMAEALPETRSELSPLAPRIECMQIPVDKIGDLIGPSGKHIRNIIETTEAQVDVEDDGTVFISTADGEAMKKARQMVLDLTADAEIGKIYEGKVVRITDFGAFVEILPKKDGLVHISELDFGRVDKVTDVCREGDMMKVKVIDIDDQGKIRLSRKEALRDDPNFDIESVPEKDRAPSPPRESGGGRGGRGGGGRDRGGRSGGGRDRGGRDRGGRDRGGRDRGGNR